MAISVGEIWCPACFGSGTDVDRFTPPMTEDELRRLFFLPHVRDGEGRGWHASPGVPCRRCDGYKRVIVYGSVSTA